MMCLITIITSNTVLAQSFSCSVGARPACLGYGDKMVSSDSTCFSSFTCSGDFVCQSDLQDVIYKNSNLIDKYNELVRKCNDKNDTIQDLLDVNEQALRKARDNKSKYDDLSLCILYSSNHEDAKNCGLMY
jgi:hypothetical protein